MNADVPGLRRSLFNRRQGCLNDFSVSVHRNRNRPAGIGRDSRRNSFPIRLHFAIDRDDPVARLKSRRLCGGAALDGSNHGLLFVGLLDGFTKSFASNTQQLMA